jgi:hypothetical protein
MVFRDYVQGAYRMRGIGIGQKIHVYIIPEVQELMRRELKNCDVFDNNNSNGNNNNNNNNNNKENDIKNTVVFENNSNNDNNNVKKNKNENITINNVNEINIYNNNNNNNVDTTTTDNNNKNNTIITTNINNNNSNNNNNKKKEDHVLEDVVAWLIINSLRSEQTQWTMLCLQNIGNLYRKNAFKCLLQNVQYFIDNKQANSILIVNNKDSDNNINDKNNNNNKEIVKFENEKEIGLKIDTKKLIANNNKNQEKHKNITNKKTNNNSNDIKTISNTIQNNINNNNLFATELDKEASLKLFNESIDFSLEAGVPDPQPFEEKLRNMLDSNENFLLPNQHAIGYRFYTFICIFF